MNHFLVLHSVDSQWAPPSLSKLSAQLHGIGLVGAERAPGQFSAGADYLNLVTYLGCSPQIALGETGEATVIRLIGPFDAPQFRSSSNLKRPRCPQCRHVLMNKGDPVLKPDDEVFCDRCGASSPVLALDWRRSAAYGRFFIDISNVFESEALPSEKLLEKLRLSTWQTWDFFYAQVP